MVFFWGGWGKAKARSASSARGVGLSPDSAAMPGAPEPRTGSPARTLPREGEPWGTPTYMEVMFLEMSVILMLVLPLLLPESCPSKRGKRFPSSGFLQLMSVLLQRQLAGQASTESR